MRISVYVAAAAVLMLVFAASPAVAAPTSSCWVTPAPVVLNQSWAVTATGLTPNATYWVNVTQAHDPSNGAHPQATLSTDSIGAGTVVYFSTDYSPDLVLGVGDAKARVYPGFDQIARGTVNCHFTVVA